LNKKKIIDFKDHPIYLLERHLKYDEALIPSKYIVDRIKNNNVAVYSARNMFEFQKAEIVIVSMISPLKEMRDNARDILTKYCKAQFIEVYMDTPLEICEQRDPKGLYKKVRAGEIKDFTGIDSPYQIPEFPEVSISREMTVEKAVDIIYNRIHNTTTIL